MTTADKNMIAGIGDDRHRPYRVWFASSGSGGLKSPQLRPARSPLRTTGTRHLDAVPRYTVCTLRRGTPAPGCPGVSESCRGWVVVGGSSRPPSAQAKAKPEPGRVRPMANGMAGSGTGRAAARYGSPWQSCCLRQHRSTWITPSIPSRWSASRCWPAPEVGRDGHTNASGCVSQCRAAGTAQAANTSSPATHAATGFQPPIRAAAGASSRITAAGRNWYRE